MAARKQREREKRTKKDVVQQLHEFAEPNADAGEYIARPNKFRKNVWIKRGDYVIVTPIEEGDKVQAEIVHILLKEHVKHLRKRGLWPKGFDEDNDDGDDGGAGAAVGAAGPAGADSGEEEVESSEEEDDMGGLPPNLNRRGPALVGASADDSEEESEDEDEEGVDGEDGEAGDDADDGDNGSGQAGGSDDDVAGAT